MLAHRHKITPSAVASSGSTKTIGVTNSDDILDPGSFVSASFETDDARLGHVGIFAAKFLFSSFITDKVRAI